MNNGNGNGNNKFLWWLIGAVLAPMLLGSTSHLLSTVYSGAERVSALEMEAQDFRRHLTNIETKLDRLLAR